MSEMSLPEHWKTEKLGQLCRVFSGYGFKTSDYTKEGIPLIKIGNLQDGEVVINPDNDYMPESWQQKEQLQKFILKSRDILIALTGATTGKTAVVSPNLAGTFLNQRVGKIELISPDVEQDFILVAIKTRFFQEVIQQNILRSAQGNISPSSIAQIPIPLPLLPEQRAIAHVLQTIQEATTARQRELALERERKAALMDYLFSYGTKGEPRKQTEIGEIPESWEVVRLEKLCVCLDSKRVPVKQSERNERKGNIPYYGASGQTGWIDDYLFDAPLLLVAEDGENLVSRKLPIAYSIEGKSWVNNHAHVLRITDINQFFLEYYFNSIDLSPYLSGTTRPKLNKASLLGIPISRPSRVETDEIALVLSSCDTKIAALEQEAERLDELFHAMLDELMTGKRSAVPLIDAELPN